MEIQNTTKLMNAKITHASLSMENHGCLTFWLTLEGNGWGCGYGGYCIGHGYLGADKFSAESGSGLVAMMKIMNVVGVSRWEDLEGKLIRVEIDEYCGSKITTIMNIIEDKWFDIDEFFKDYAKEENR